MKIEFIHLGVRSEYTILNSICKLEDILKRGLELNMPYIGLSDINTMFSCYTFEKICTKNKHVKNLIGVTFYVKSEFKDSYFALTLFAKNQQGYRNIANLSTIANTGRKDFAFVTMDEFMEYSSDCICLTGGCAGELFHLVVNNDLEKAESLISKLVGNLGNENVYLELTNHFLPDEKIFLEHSFVGDMCKKYGIEVVATNHIHYMKKEHSFHRAIALEMNPNKAGTNAYSKYVDFNDEFYFKSQEEMYEVFEPYFHIYPNIFSNTLKIAEICSDVKVPVERALPQFPLPDGITSEKYLEKLVWEGFNKRFPDSSSFAQGFTRQDYIDRLEYEFETIKNMGFIDYFIIVQDFINFAKDMEVYKHPEIYFPENHFKKEDISEELWNKDFEIYVGPGRGSAAGSLLAYCLKITEGLDPIKNRLLFERFLNVERVSMPDIDIDFSNAHRQLVVQYVQEKYGFKKVAQIVTYQTMQVKKIIKAVGKTLGMPFSMTNEMTQNVPFCLREGDKEIPITSLNQLSSLPYFKNLLVHNEDIRKLFDIGLVLEGLPSSTGKHAAGVIIGRQELNSYLPLMEVDGVMVTQFEKGSCEEIGLLKMDFLGLKTLDILQKTLNLVKKIHGIDMSLYDIPQEDSKTYDLLKSGKTGKVFQIESPGMVNLFKNMQPDTFEDINAAIALYRPGPMAFIPDYLENRKNPDKIKYPHPLFEDVTKATYGVLIYQEQIMEVVQKLAGFTLGHADILRKAISKKKKDIIEEEKKLFIQGCKDVNDIDEENARYIFEQIEPFADYGFNRSHSAAYGIVSYDTAYCKAHFPECFMAANLTLASQDAKDLAYTLAECSRCGIKILPPDVERSECEFSVELYEGELAIRYSYAAIKGVGENAAVEFAKIRNVSSLGEFISNLPADLIRSSQLANIIHAGVFDKFGSRREMVDSIPDIIGFIKAKSSIDNAGLANFLTEYDFKEKYIGHEYSEFKRLDLEKEAVSVILSGHPIASVRSLFPEYDRTMIDYIIADEGSPLPSTIDVLCQLSNLKLIQTKKGMNMCTVEIEDEFQSMEGIVFPKNFDKMKDKINECIDRPVVVNGKIDYKTNDDGTLKYIFIINTIEKAIKNNYRIYIDKTSINEKQKNELLRYNGIVNVIFVDIVNQRYEPQKFSVDLSDELLRYMKDERIRYHAVN